MITWKATNNVTACIFYSKNDAKLTGPSYRARGEKVLLLDSEYADDTAILFDNREDLTNGVNRVVTHFTQFGMEVHTEKIEPRGELKTDILFCSKPCSTYNDRDSYDNADLSDIIVSHDRYKPIVYHFSYLGSFISSNSTDNNDFEARIRKVGGAFGALSKSIFPSLNVNRKVNSHNGIHIIDSANTSLWLRMLVSHGTSSMKAKNLPPPVCQKNV